MMKLNNMLTLGYALFVLHAPNSVGTYQAVKSNNAVSHPGRPESPATPLSELGWKVGSYGLDTSYSQRGLAVSSCGDSN